MTVQHPTKTPQAPHADAAQPEATPRVRPKLSLHYGAKPGGERK